MQLKVAPFYQRIYGATRLALTLLTLWLLTNNFTMGLHCRQNASMAPMVLNQDIALMAGDVVTFHSSDPPGYLSAIDPGSMSRHKLNGEAKDTTCSLLPLHIAENATAAAQFIVLPVAVLDPDMEAGAASGQAATSSTENGDPITATLTDDAPRLVSTVQLVHVTDGRLLGMLRKKKCRQNSAFSKYDWKVLSRFRQLFSDLGGEDILENAQAAPQCQVEITLVPLLLPRSFNSPCKYKLDDFETIWDLNAYKTSVANVVGRSINGTFVENVLNRIISGGVNRTLNDADLSGREGNESGTQSQNDASSTTETFSNFFFTEPQTVHTKSHDVLGNGSVIADVPVSTRDSQWQVFQTPGPGGADPLGALSALTGLGASVGPTPSPTSPGAIAGTAPSSIADAVGLGSSFSALTPAVDLALRQNNENIRDFQPGEVFTPDAEKAINEQQRQLLQRSRDDVLKLRLGEQGAASLSNGTKKAVVSLRLRISHESLAELVTPCQSFVSLNSDDHLDTEFGAAFDGHHDETVSSETGDQSEPSSTAAPPPERYIDGRSMTPFGDEQMDSAKKNKHTLRSSSKRRVKFFSNDSAQKRMSSLGKKIGDTVRNGYNRIMAWMSGESNHPEKMKTNQRLDANSRSTYPNKPQQKKTVFSKSAKIRSTIDANARELALSRQKRGVHSHTPKDAKRLLPSITSKQHLLGSPRSPLTGIGGHPLAIFDTENDYQNSDASMSPQQAATQNGPVFKRRIRLDDLSKGDHRALRMSHRDIETGFKKAESEYIKPTYSSDRPLAKTRRSYLDGDLDPLSTSTASDLQLQALMYDGLRDIRKVKEQQLKNEKLSSRLAERGFAILNEGDNYEGKLRQFETKKNLAGNGIDDTDEVDSFATRLNLTSLMFADIHEICPKWWESSLVTAATISGPKLKCKGCTSSKFRALSIQAPHSDAIRSSMQREQILRAQFVHNLVRNTPSPHTNLTFARVRQLRHQYRQLIKELTIKERPMRSRKATVYRVQGKTGASNKRGIPSYVFRHSQTFEGTQSEIQVLENDLITESACHLNHLRGNIAVMRAAQDEEPIFDMDEGFHERIAGHDEPDEEEEEHEHEHENHEYPGCTPTASTCSAGAAADSGMLWTLTRLPFHDVPTSSLFLAESMTEVSYNLDGAFADIMPFSVGQIALRNYSPFEQYLSARALKRVYFISTFRWSVTIQPQIEIAFVDIPTVIDGLVDNVVIPGLGALIGGLLETIIPGSQAIIDQIGEIISGAFPLTTIGVSLLTLAVPVTWSGSYSHAEEFELGATFALTAPPLSHLVGRSVVNIGRNSVPFAVDINRKLYVPPGTYGQVVGQVIDFDYTIPGIFEGANLVNTEFIVDTL